MTTATSQETLRASTDVVCVALPIAGKKCINRQGAAFMYRAEMILLK